MWTRRLLIVAGILGSAVPAAPADNPFATPPVDGLIPALPGGTLALPPAPIAFTGSAFVHEGRTTWGGDLVDPGTPSPTTWEGWFDPVPGPLRYTAAPTFPVRVDQAWGAAKSHLGALDPATIGDVFGLFDTLEDFMPGASATVTKPDTPKSFFFGYRPLRARWLGSQWGRPGPLSFQPEKNYAYADYTGFRDVRIRGARLYCAARRAQLEQAGMPASLGERVGFSVSLVGHTIDFLVVEPTLALDGPERFTGAAGDLTRAFTVPFLLGTRITPIRGLGLPGFGEIRVPLELVSGDSEVATGAEKRPVFVGWKFQCPPCQLVPDFVSRHSKTYRTVTHVDAISSAGFAAEKAFHADATFTLFVLGPLKISGLLGLGFEVGAFETRDERVLAGFPTPMAREGFLLENPLGHVRYHDGPWLVARRPYLHWQVQPEGKTDPFWTRPILPLLGHVDLRAATNDDHLAESRTSLTLDLGLKGELTAGGGPFEITLSVEGHVGGNVAQRFELRDALMAQDPLEPGFLPRMRPITAVSIHPRQTASVGFNGLTAKLRFYMDLFFGEIDFTKTFFSLEPQPIASYDSFDSLAPGDEAYVFRLGTGSSAGQPLKKPAVLSHLPQRAHFASFDEDVDACLADETPLPEIPPPCEAQIDDGAPPKAEICLYGPGFRTLVDLVPQVTPGICGKIDAFLSEAGLVGAQGQCVGNYLRFLCAPTSKEQSFEGSLVIGRVWNLDEAMNDELHAILDQCAEAFTKNKAEAQELAENLIGVAACKADATLLGEADLVGIGSPGQAPKAQPGSCGS